MQVIKILFELSGRHQPAMPFPSNKFYAKGKHYVIYYLYYSSIPRLNTALEKNTPAFTNTTEYDIYDESGDFYNINNIIRQYE